LAKNVYKYMAGPDDCSLKAAQVRLSTKNDSIVRCF
jgi:hypothetical protein